MADIYVKSSAGGAIGSGTYRGNWTASQTYALGDRVCGVAVSDYWMFECTTAGTAGATEPTWTKTDGVTTVDSGVTWTARIPDTWADATLTLAKAAANDAAGDNIWVSHQHNETTPVTTTLTFAGTFSAPTKIICVNDSSGVAATTAVASFTGSVNLAITGSIYCYGIVFNAATTGVNLLNISATVDSTQIFEQSQFATSSTSANARFTVGGASGVDTFTKFISCQFKFGGATQGFTLQRSNVIFNGCSLRSDSSAITAICYVPNADQTLAYFSDCNFEFAASTVSLVASGATVAAFITAINCKMPVSWTGGATSGAPEHPGCIVKLYNCGGTSGNYNVNISKYAGVIIQETTLVKTGGATDGTTVLSWKLVTNANANEYVAPLITDDMAVWIDNVGSSKTVTVDILHDSLTNLTDADIWLEIDYLGSTSYPIGIPLSDKRATVLTTAADQTTSTASWITTGLTNPNKQKLEVTFLPQMKGFVYARVCLAKPSYTVYVDPKLVVA
mgnify:CR=1 FL=1